jgi:DNA-binding transcriptional regulator YiaG
MNVSQETLDAVRRLKSEGHSLTVLSQQFKCSRRSIQKMMEPEAVANGPLLPQPPWLEKAKEIRKNNRLSYKKIGELFGVSESTAQKWINREIDGVSIEKMHYRASSPVHEGLRERWTPKHVPRRRVIAGEPDPVTMSAAQLFAAGKIDRAALIAALTNGRMP